MKKPYVVHYCRNKNCNRAWLDEDETGAKSRPPQYKYCSLCELNGYVTTKDPARVARGRMLAEKAREKARKRQEALDGL